MITAPANLEYSKWRMKKKKHTLSGLPHRRFFFFKFICGRTDSISKSQRPGNYRWLLSGLSWEATSPFILGCTGCFLVSQRLLRRLSWESGGVILELTSLGADTQPCFLPPRDTFSDLQHTLHCPHLTPGPLSHFLSLRLAAKLPFVKNSIKHIWKNAVTETECLLTL